MVTIVIARAACTIVMANGNGNDGTPAGRTFRVMMFDVTLVGSELLVTCGSK